MAVVVVMEKNEQIQGGRTQKWVDMVIRFNIADESRVMTLLLKSGKLERSRFG